MTYVKGLSALYCNQAQLTANVVDQTTGANPAKIPMNDAQKRQVLATLKDFSSIAKSGTLNNLFLATFSELVQKKQN